MGVRNIYVRNSRASGEDARQRIVFLSAIVVFATVAFGLFYGSSQGVVPSVSTASLLPSSSTRTVVLHSTAAPTPVLLASNTSTTTKSPISDLVAKDSWLAPQYNSP